MDQERLPSFLVSLCLHLALFALVLFWPGPSIPPYDPTHTTIHTGIITIGKEGKSVASARKNTPQPQRGPETPQNVVEKPKVEQQKPEVAPVPTKDPVQQKAEVKPVEKAPDAVPIPKEPDKPKVQNATAKAPETKTQNATAKAPETKPQNASKPAPKEDLSKALADMQRQAGTRGGARSGASSGDASGKGQDLSSALADLGKDVGGSGNDAYGTGPGGRGGDGVGLLGSYQDSIVSRVKPNWAWPGRTDRRNFIAIVNVKIAADGTIKDVRIISSSGNSYFDSTVVRAVVATKRLEAPPKPEYMDMDISFNSNELTKR